MENGGLQNQGKPKDKAFCVYYSVKNGGVQGTDAEVVRAHTEYDAALEFSASTSIMMESIVEIRPLDEVKDNA